MAELVEEESGLDLAGLVDDQADANDAFDAQGLGLGGIVLAGIEVAEVALGHRARLDGGDGGRCRLRRSRASTDAGAGPGARASAADVAGIAGPLRDGDAG